MGDSALCRGNRQLNESVKTVSLEQGNLPEQWHLLRLSSPSRQCRSNWRRAESLFSGQGGWTRWAQQYPSFNSGYPWFCDPEFTLKNQEETSLMWQKHQSIETKVTDVYNYCFVDFSGVFPLSHLFRLPKFYLTSWSEHQSLEFSLILPFPCASPLWTLRPSHQLVFSNCICDCMKPVFPQFPTWLWAFVPSDLKSGEELESFSPNVR